jgi:hypothetical protein
MASQIQPDASKKPAQPAAAKPVAANPAKPAATPANPPAAAAKPAAKPAAPGAKPAAAPPQQPPQQKAPPPKPEPEEHEEADDSPRRSIGSGILRQAPAWAVSMLVHIVVLLSMALIVQDPPKEEKPRVITSSAAENQEEFEEFEEELPQDQPDTPQEVSNEVVLPDASVVPDVQVVTEAADVDAAAVAVEFTDFSTETAASSDLLSAVGVVGGKGGGIGGRSGAQRQQLVQSGGGTPQSEAAVEAALKWFIEHQMPDGSWVFDLKKCPSCQGQCSHSGSHGSAAGATALALLPFLGRGYTHKEGPYKKQLEFALNALATQVVKGNGNAGGGSYVQGLTGICLSEAYAMTQDPRLQMPAQLAVNYIMASQDPVGGGWGYGYRSPGDTSIVGWNLMGLKSGHMAYLSVDPMCVKRAVGFLDSMQTDEGAAYGYNAPGSKPSLNAAGLLCRMYLGWKKDHPALNRGVDRLAKAGPTNDLYYDYYGTQVMHHVEGDRWVAWNAKMRDLLVKEQATQGHEKGSWGDPFLKASHGESGGRIYVTSLATMILEVYYRHLPIYSQQSVDEEFKE